MEEQLEIDLEQQALKVVNQTPVIVKPTPIPIQIVTAPPPPQQQQTGGKKSQAPVSVNIMDFIKPKAASNVSEIEHNYQDMSIPVNPNVVSYSIYFR